MDLRNILEEFLMDSNCAFYKKVVVVGEGHCGYILLFNINFVYWDSQW